MNPITIMAATEASKVAGQGVKAAGKATGRVAGSLFNEPIVGNFTLKKMTVWLAGAFILYLVWYFFIRKTDADKAADKAAETVNGLPIDASNMTLSTADINLIAQQLYNAMEGWGTDEDAIMSVFDRISTKDDLLAVMKRFGTPKYTPPMSLSGDYIDLTGWLKAELGGSDLTHVRDLFLNFGIPF
ncbi:MAG: annexin [Prevotellaceae bacterium]|jgi:preprotein translocase subunit SecG|nr:annexin [Prevotellaceae bacterium]